MYLHDHTIVSMALCIQVYLKMDRVDKAEQQLKVTWASRTGPLKVLK